MITRTLACCLPLALALTSTSAQPFLTKHPTNASLSLGASVKFLVSATSTSPPIRFQWRLTATNLAGETNSTLNLTNIQLINAGDYDAVLTDNSGSVTSNVAHLEVDPTFTKITTGPVVTDAADGEGTAWVDYDNDGDLDLYVSSGDTLKNLLYRNDGNGVFVQITNGPIVNAGGSAFSASWADIDNNGFIALFVSKGNSRGILFRQQTNGSFIQTSLASGGSSVSAAWGDYDNDGFVDLLVADHTRNILWHNDGTGNLIAITNTPIDTSRAFVITWVDYDNDGDQDLFVGNLATNSQLYRNDGAGIFVPITTGPIAANSAKVVGAAWGDYDNDGFPDLFLARVPAGGPPPPSFLFHNNGDGTFSQVNVKPFTDDLGDTAGVAWGDYDNDGWLDLFVTDFQGRGNRLYHNNGDGTFTRIVSGSVVNDRGGSSSAAWGDYDHDGFLDLFVANGTNGGGESKDYLYYNNQGSIGNTNGWILVKCVGTVSNRSAIGTKVRVKATIMGKTFWQLREISTADGQSVNPLEAHFGLGNATNIEMIRIEWPSGTVQEFQNVAPKQFLTITEPSRLLAGVVNGAPQFMLKGGRGLQYDIETSTNLTAWSQLGTVTITNVDGTASIADTNASGSDRRFYRALQH
jgi:enediyne biosynthesis protein E4